MPPASADPFATAQHDEGFDRVLQSVKLRAPGGRSGRRTRAHVPRLRDRTDAQLRRRLRGARQRPADLLEEAAEALPGIPGDPRSPGRLAVFRPQLGHTISATSTATITRTNTETTEPGAIFAGVLSVLRTGTEDARGAVVCIGTRCRTRGCERCRWEGLPRCTTGRRFRVARSCPRRGGALPRGDA